MVKRAWLVVLVLASAALVPRSGEPARVETGAEFALKVGRCAVVEPLGTKLCFDRVVEDSRCPKGAMCIRAGNARISVSVAPADGDAARLELNTAEGAKRGVAGGLEIELLSVDPYPVVHRPVDPTAYTATFSVKVVKK